MCSYVSILESGEVCVARDRGGVAGAEAASRGGAECMRRFIADRPHPLRASPQGTPPPQDIIVITLTLPIPNAHNNANPKTDCRA